jgi:hypothetical protein
MTGSFLHEPPVSPRVQALYDDDLAGDGYIWSLSGCGRTSQRPSSGCSS